MFCVRSLVARRAPARPEHLTLNFALAQHPQPQEADFCACTFRGMRDSIHDRRWQGKTRLQVRKPLRWP